MTEKVSWLVLPEGCFCCSVLPFVQGFEMNRLTCRKVSACPVYIQHLMDLQVRLVRALLCTPDLLVWLASVFIPQLNLSRRSGSFSFPCSRVASDLSVFFFSPL